MFVPPLTSFYFLFNLSCPKREQKQDDCKGGKELSTKILYIHLITEAIVFNWHFIFQTHCAKNQNRDGDAELLQGTKVSASQSSARQLVEMRTSPLDQIAWK